MSHNIEWINTTNPTVDYSEAAVVDNDDDVIDKYTDKFEAEFKLKGGDDVGGIIIYSNDVVYDYENFVGWVK
jgi:hypothetical protein